MDNFTPRMPSNPPVQPATVPPRGPVAPAPITPLRPQPPRPADSTNTPRYPSIPGRAPDPAVRPL
jgi:hypothetical protein